MRKFLKYFGATLLLLAPGLALAGPGGGGGIVGAIVGVVAVVAAPFTGGLSLAYFAAAVVAGAAVGYMVGSTIEMIINPPSFDMPATSNASAESQNQGIQINKQGTNVNIPVVYGQRKIGGTRVFVSTNGTDNSNLYICLVLAEGEINSITKVWIEDTVVWAGASTHGGSYSASTSNFQTYFSFQTFHGTTTQSASSLLKEASGWGDDKQLKGLAYIACKCVWPKITTNDEAKKNPWNGIPNITVEIQGKRVSYPTNLGITYTGLTYEQRQAFSKTNYLATTGYSNNPVDCLLDYLRNPIYGKGMADTQIDWHSFYSARVRWIKDQAGSNLADNKIHKTNAVLFTDRTVMDNVKTFLLNMRSALVYQDGRYRLVTVDNGNESSIYAATSTSVMTVNENDIIDGIRIEAEKGENKYNRVIVSYMGYVDGAGDKTYEPVEYTYPEADSSLETTYLAQDNNRVVETRITLEHITDATTAAKLAQIILERSRNKGKTITLHGTSRLYQLEIGDVITLQYSSLSINGQYRVKNIVQNVDFTFQITLEEHNDVTYAYNPTPQVVSSYQSSVIGSGDVVTGPVFPNNGRVGTVTGVPVTTVESEFLANPDRVVLRVYYTEPTDTTLRKLRIYSQDFNTGSYYQFQEFDVVSGNPGRQAQWQQPVSPSTRYKLRVHSVDAQGQEGSPYYFDITTTNLNTSTLTNGVQF